MAVKYKVRLYNLKNYQIHKNKKPKKIKENYVPETPRIRRKFEYYIQENNLKPNITNFRKFRTQQNKIDKIQRLKKADSRINRILKDFNIQDQYKNEIKRSVISYYKGKKGFTEKQYQKLVNDTRNLNKIEVAKKVLPKIVKPDMSTMKAIKNINNIEDLTKVLFRSDADIYFELRDLIIAYNDNPDKYGDELATR
jgi:hypothetical protein